MSVPGCAPRREVFAAITAQRAKLLRGREQGNEALLDRWNHQLTAILSSGWGKLMIEGTPLKKIIMKKNLGNKNYKGLIINA